jgi:predicted RecB family nuclease
VKWVRNDVSEVPPQGGYVAKQCPVRAQWDVLQPAPLLPVPESAQRRMADGVEFEAEVFDRLTELHSSAVVIHRGGPEDRADREQRTLHAMDSGAFLILGGRLPAEPAARRVGEPDVLVAAPGGGYHPVDVKHHRTLTSGWGVPTVVADLADPSHAHAEAPDDLCAVKQKGDLFQLAHYRRMLEACGHAAPDGLGAIIGSELTVTWYDLDAAIWTTPSRSEGTKQRSTINVYDFEFAFRLDIIEVARRHRDDPSVELLVVPVRTGECASCPWWGHCEQLLTDADDVSLLPFSGWKMWAAHRDRGVHTVADLAALDWRTAQLIEQGVDLAHLFDRLDGAADDTPIGEVIGRAKRGQIARLEASGVHTAADARSLDRRLAAYAPRSVRNLSASIDMARARRAAPPVFLARGIDRIEVPRGEVEVDLDLENADDGGVYLWGALVTDRAGTGLVDEGYRPFVTWDPDLAIGEVVVFDQLCSWLEQLLDTTTAAGHAVTVYCFNEMAEAGALRRLASLPQADPRWGPLVEQLVTSDAWVDLLPICRAGLVTGGPMGLKHLAPLAGFEWEDDDPGGEQSMTWYHHAAHDPDPEVRAANQRRILTYNRNDVEATLALRNWLEHDSSELPSINSLDHHHHA